MKIDISIGELVDKVTILEIKLERIKAEEKLINIRNEYNTLKKSMEEIGITSDSEIFMRLKKINIKLWEIEDNIRIKEFKQEFDDEFIKLARSVYFENDERAAIKRDINTKFNSNFFEEKEYVDYKKV